MPIQGFFWGEMDINSKLRKILKGGNLTEIIDLGPLYNWMLNKK
jgi:hypothetical protein